MKKKWLLIGLIMAVLAVSGGVFAFTYTTATASIGVTAVKSDFADVKGFNIDIGKVLGKQRGELPTGKKVFEITPHSAYSGDLVVKVYLTNAGTLSRAYQHLNMKLALQNSEEWKDADHKYQVLTLDNAVVTFNLNGQYGKKCELTLEGGSYATNPQETLTWDSDSAQPLLYCEVTQR